MRSGRPLELWTVRNVGSPPSPRGRPNLKHVPPRKMAKLLSSIQPRRSPVHSSRWLLISPQLLWRSQMIPNPTRRSWRRPWRFSSEHQASEIIASAWSVFFGARSLTCVRPPGSSNQVLFFVVLVLFPCIYCLDTCAKLVIVGSLEFWPSLPGWPTRAHRFFEGEEPVQRSQRPCARHVTHP